MLRASILLLYFLCITGIGSSQTTTIEKDTLGTSKAELYLKKLRLAYKDGNYELHKTYSDSLFISAKENKLIRFQILGMINQAIYFNNRCEHTESVALYREALSLSDSIPKDYRTKIIVLVNLGNAYTNIKSHRKAINTMNEVISLLDQFEDNPKIRASALNGIANNHEGLDEIEKSLEYHFKSKQLGESIEDESIVATSLNNIGDIYQRHGDYEKAIDAITMALALQSAQKPTKERAWLLFNLGLCQQKLGDVAQSISTLEQAQKLALEKGLSEIEMETYEHLAEVYEVNNNVQKAREAKEKFLTLKNEILENRQDATKFDLEKDLSAKNEVIESNETVIAKLIKKRNTLFYWVGICMGILALVIILFLTYRKSSSLKQQQLQKQFLSLKYYNTTPTDQIKKQKNKNPQPASYKNSSLTKEDLLKYKELLEAFMSQKKPYLNSELSQSNLASQLEISSHHLSEVLNTVFNQNFYNFINSYRVLEAQQLMQKDTEKKHKILTFAFDAGFKSKTSFNRIFKSHTGLTPSDYRKSLTR